MRNQVAGVYGPSHKYDLIENFDADMKKAAKQYQEISDSGLIDMTNTRDIRDLAAHFGMTELSKVRNMWLISTLARKDFEIRIHRVLDELVVNVAVEGETI